MRGWLAAALAVAGKDLRLELRSRERMMVMLVFAALVAIVFAFALDPGVRAQEIGAAMIWVTILFAGMLGLGRSFALEREEEALSGLLASPAPRTALFAGKLAANLVLVLGVAALVFPVYGLLFPIRYEGSGVAIAAVVLLACLGFMTLGTLFAAMSVHTRMGDSLLPVVLLPLLVPVVILAAGATHRLMAGRPVAEVSGGLRVLLALDLVYLLVCTYLFRHVVEE